MCVSDLSWLCNWTAAKLCCTNYYLQNFFIYSIKRWKSAYFLLRFATFSCWTARDTWPRWGCCVLSRRLSLLLGFFNSSIHCGTLQPELCTTWAILQQEQGVRKLKEGCESTAVCQNRLLCGWSEIFLLSLRELSVASMIPNMSTTSI